MSQVRPVKKKKKAKCKGLATLITFVWFLPSMNSLMLSQACMPLNSFVTVCTSCKTSLQCEVTNADKNLTADKGFVTFCTFL